MVLLFELPFICVLVLLLNTRIMNSSSAGVIRMKTYHSVNSSLGIRLIGSNFTSDSKAICASKCQSKYPSACQSFIYDPKTKQCLPGGELKTSETKPQTGQLIYSNCDFSLGYSYSILIQFGYCVYISLVMVEFATAEDHCRNMSSRLMTVKTLERVQFLTNFTSTQNLNAIWIGLDDRATEGTYMWSDGVQATTLQLASFCLNGEPSNSNNNEDCFTFARRLPGFGLNDAPCTGLLRPFICEYVV